MVTLVLRYTNAMETAKTPGEKTEAAAGKSSLSGLRFNSTGREDTTVQVMKTQRDPGAGKKIAIVIALIVFATAALGAISYERSGLKISDALNAPSQPGLGSHTSDQEVVK